MMPLAPVANGMAGVEARIAEIQNRLEGLVARPASAQPFQLPEEPVRADATTRGRASSPSTGLAPAAAVPSATPSNPATSATGELPAWASELPDAAAQWIPAIEQAAVEAGIEPTLLAALVRHESNFDQSMISHAGAIGLGQLMPGTADWLGVDPHDPHENLTGAATYLRQQLDRFGSPDLALAAYNAGPNRVADAGGIPQIQETQLYVGRVLDTWEQLR